MKRLALTLFWMIAPTLAGVGAVVALVSGFTTLVPLLISAAVGFVLSIPASLFLARKLSG